MKDTRIALAVCRSAYGQWAQNLDAIARHTRKAKDQGATLICFPELFISGYSPRAQIDATCQPVPGPVTETVSQIAARETITILAGLAECGNHGQIFASHLVFSPDGNVRTYRKIHIAPPEKQVFTPGNRMPLFKLPGATFGIALCYDAHFPELSTHLALKGADILFMPHASPRGTAEEKLQSWRRHLPARAFDNGVYVLACNQSGENGAGLEFPGVAMVIDPAGKVMAEYVPADGEGLLVVNLPGERIEAVRSHSMRYFLPNRRSDIDYFRNP
ncbi:MAG: nitrilase [Deltaproteobacteria bacterium]|nr:nitrilase [Deltaproteobacteria bacterium]